jgi:hypothetical protein
VNVEDVATPSSLVKSVSVFVPFAKVPLAPEAGAVNVTFSPLIFAPLTVTVAVRGALNVLPFAALCDEPLLAAIATVSE